MSDLDPLEKACLTGLSSDRYGYRFAPSVSADAVRQALSGALAEVRPEVRNWLRSLDDPGTVVSPEDALDAVMGLVGRAVMLTGDDELAGMCGVEHPWKSVYRCTMEGMEHDRLKDPNGEFWDHGDPNSGAWWNLETRHHGPSSYVLPKGARIEDDGSVSISVEWTAE